MSGRAAARVHSYPVAGRSCLGGLARAALLSRELSPHITLYLARTLLRLLRACPKVPFVYIPPRETDELIAKVSLVYQHKVPISLVN